MNFRRPAQLDRMYQTRMQHQRRAPKAQPRNHHVRCTVAAAVAEPWHLYPPRIGSRLAEMEAANLRPRRRSNPPMPTKLGDTHVTPQLVGCSAPLMISEASTHL